ncbi:hypothetical protein FGF1_43380 [Flavobacteriaceae bacterium GF1]
MKQTTWVVIPGIGNQKPGETVTALARSLGTRNHATVQSQKDCYLAEGGDDSKIKTFHVPMVDASSPNQTTHFKELYWNDLSTVKESWWGIAKGLFNVVTGLRHLVTPTEKNEQSKPLAILAQVFFWLVGGPILGGSALVFMVWAILLAIHGGMQLHYESQQVQELLNHQLNWVFPLVCLFIGFVILLLPLKVKGERLRSYWTMKCVAILALVLVIAFPILNHYRPDDFTTVSDSIFSAIVIPVVGFWAVTNVVMLLLFGATFVQHIRFGIKNHPYIIIPALSTILTMVFLIAAIPILIIGSNTLTPTSLQFADMDKVVKTSLPTVGWIWIGFVIVVVFALLLAYLRAQWFSNNTNQISSDNSPPRLVFSPFLFWVLFTLSVPAIAAFFINLMGRFVDIKALEYINELTDVLRLGVIVTIPLILPLLALAKPGIRLALDLTLDIVNYFKPKPSQAFKPWRTAYDKIGFEFREQVLQRLDKIMDFAAQGEGAKKLILVTHSQGTIFGLDYVSNPKNQSRLAGFDSVVLVTMGSPFTYVYQHYFPDIFTQNERYETIKKVLGKNPWLNIYCSDDYIGTYIAPYESGVDETSRYPKNIETGSGGHTGYFEDARVMAELERF